MERSVATVSAWMTNGTRARTRERATRRRTRSTGTPPASSPSTRTPSRRASRRSATSRSAKRTSSEPSKLAARRARASCPTTWTGATSTGRKRRVLQRDGQCHQRAALASPPQVQLASKGLYRDGRDGQTQTEGLGLGGEEGIEGLVWRLGPGPGALVSHLHPHAVLLDPGHDRWSGSR